MFLQEEGEEGADGEEGDGKEGESGKREEVSLFSVAIHNCMFTNKETTQYLTQQTPLR